MSEPSARRDEIAALIREQSKAKPWPEVRETLLDQGASEEEIEAALEAAFPGKPRRKVSSVKAGMVGAGVGVLLWAVLAFFFKRL